MNINNQKSQHPLHAAGSQVIREQAWLVGGLSLIPIPMVDIGALMTIEILTLRRLAELYGRDFSEDLARNVILSLLTASGSVIIAKKLLVGALAATPGFRGLIAGAKILSAVPLHFALGHHIQSRLEAGEDFSDMVVKPVSPANAATEAAQ